MRTKHGHRTQPAALPGRSPKGHERRCQYSPWRSSSRFLRGADVVSLAWLRLIPARVLAAPTLPVVHRSQMWALCPSLATGLDAVSYIPWLVGQRGGSPLVWS